MPETRKSPRITTRYSAPQLERLGIAACIESRRRHEDVDESSLSREITNRGVDVLFAGATEAELDQARADYAVRQREAKKRRRVKEAA